MSVPNNLMNSPLQNVRLFKMASVAGAVQDEVGHARWVSMDGTAWKFGYWALAFLLFALLTTNLFFAGGVLSCLSIFFRYRQRGIRMRQQAKSVVSPSPSIVEP
jgi:hypothetical protein